MARQRHVEVYQRHVIYLTLRDVTEQFTIQTDHLYCSVPLSAAAIAPRTHALTSANNTTATNNNQTATNTFNTTRQR